MQLPYQPHWAPGFPPSITTQPQSQYTVSGTKARFQATGINGTSPITYQWKLNGTNVNLLADAANYTGATSNVLTIASATASAASYGHIRHSASSGETRPIAQAP